MTGLPYNVHKKTKMNIIFVLLWLKIAFGIGSRKLDKYCHDNFQKSVKFCFYFILFTLHVSKISYELKEKYILICHIVLQLCYIVFCITCYRYVQSWKIYFISKLSKKHIICTNWQRFYFPNIFLYLYTFQLAFFSNISVIS